MRPEGADVRTEDMTGLRHIPRDWRYREVPDWARHAVGGDAYRRYCKWLAHHLRSNEFPMNPAQQRLSDSWSDKSPTGIAIELADSLGYLIWDRDGLEEHARQATPYSEIERQERELWQETSAADPDIAEPFEDVKTPEEDYARICEETKDADLLRDQIPHADIGIRPLLALAVKQCVSDQEAEEIVMLFYDTFDESASK